MCRFLAVGLATVLTASPPLTADAGPTITVSPDLQAQRPALEATIHKAFERLGAFADRHGFAQHLGPDFIKAVRVYGTEAAFEQAVTTVTGYPSSDGGKVIARTLFVASPELSKPLTYEADSPQAWEKLITHELAHQLHLDLVDQDRKRLGPVWFYEGFAAVAADQFAPDLPVLSRETRQHILFEKRRGSFRPYEAMVRYYLTGATMAELVQHGGQADFESWLAQTFQDVPVPAPTPANPLHRSM
jgi:hypothetical protein